MAPDLLLRARAPQTQGQRRRTSHTDAEDTLAQACARRRCRSLWRALLCETFVLSPWRRTIRRGEEHMRTIVGGGSSVRIREMRRVRLPNCGLCARRSPCLRWRASVLLCRLEQDGSIRKWLCLCVSLTTSSGILPQKNQHRPLSHRWQIPHAAQTQSESREGELGGGCIRARTCDLMRGLGFITSWRVLKTGELYVQDASSQQDDASY